MKKIFTIFFSIFLALSANAVTLTVTNCSSSSSDPGSLPFVVVQANAELLPVLVDFNIPTAEAGYTTEAGVSFWRISLQEMLSLTHNAIYLAGNSQKSFAGNSNPLGPEIEITAGTSSILEALIKISSINDCTIEGLAINGSTGAGIKIASGNRNSILGNYIGTTVTGEAAKANASDGVVLDGSTLNNIGGLGTLDGNIISGNTGSGVHVVRSTANGIIGNRIGTGTTDAASIPNVLFGVSLETVSQMQTVESNVISFNGKYGILIDGASTKFNALYKNRMFSNTLSGIKLVNEANQNILFPSISTGEAYTLSGRTYVAGTSAANAHIEIFQVETPEVDTAGEGKTFLGSTEADANGQWFTYFSVDLSEQKVTATQTGVSFDTSEFALNKGPISKAVEYRPDAEIGIVSDASDYIGSNIINSSGFEQTKSQSVLAGQTAIYYIRAKNTGTTSDAIVVTGISGTSSWEVLYFDAKSGGNNITGLVTIDGWTSASLASSEGIEFRVESKSLVSDIITKKVYITCTSQNDPNKKDVVLATTVTSLPAQSLSSFTFISPASAEVNTAFLMTIEARNSSGIITTEVRDATSFSVDFGAVTPSQLDAVQFTDDGIWAGNVTLSKVGARRITATNGIVSNYAEVVVYNATSEFTDNSLGVKVVVPSGAASSEVSITIAELLSLPGSPPSGKWQAGKIIDLTSNVSTFLAPLVITLSLYSGAKIPDAYFWDGSAWSKTGLSGAVKTDSSITFNSTHLTAFVPFDDTQAAQYIFGPSPYDPAKDGVSYFWYWLTAQKKTTLLMFDLIGNLVVRKDFESGTNGARGGQNNISWDGKNLLGNMLGNGTYVYQIIQENHPISRGKLIILRR